MERKENSSPEQKQLKAHPLEDGRRKAKFLSLFSIVQFPNTECTTASDDMGTCFTTSECSSKGGEADGGCAAGFGTCCRFSATCGDTMQQNGTYFVNPESVPRVCRLMVTPLNDNICQVRFDIRNLSKIYYIIEYNLYYHMLLIFMAQISHPNFLMFSVLQYFQYKRNTLTINFQCLLDNLT